MKKVGKYLIITLLMLLGLGCVGVLYLFFIPNSSLFNITYINNHYNKQSTIYQAADVSEIVLNSRSYDIEILNSKENTVSLEVYSNSFGFVLTKNQDIKLSSNLKNSTLTFDVVEPHGFAISNTSFIKLYVPTSKAFDLKIINKSANVLINSNDLKINNLTYSTDRGDFDFISGSLTGILNINLNKGTFKINPAVQTNNNNVILKLSSGRFYATNEVLGDIEIQHNKRGIISIDTCKILTENISSAGGQIYVKKLSHINITTSDTYITIDEVTDGATINLTGSGKVSIKKLDGVSTISTNTGSIKIDNVESILTVDSHSGNINVNNAKLKVVVSTNYGNANINFSNSAESHTENSNARVLYAKIYNGKLTATGVENIGNINTNNDNGIEVTGNGRVVLKMKNVLGENVLRGKNGSINVVVEKTASYVLNTSSKKGSVRVNLTQTIQYGGYTTKAETVTNVNCETSSNTLTISTNSGDLTVFDTNFAS